MNCWEVLGIEPKSDKKTIKIAYAKSLKQTRPDEDPEGFQRLHSAYKEALSWEDYYADEYQWDNEDSEDTNESFETPEIKSTTIIETLDHDDVFFGGEEPVEATLNTPKPADTDVFDNEELIESTLPSPETFLDELETAEQTETLEKLSDEDLQLLEDIRQQELDLNNSWEDFRRQVNALITDKKACNKLDNWHFLETMPAMKDLEFRTNAADNLFETVSALNEESLKKKSLYIKRPVINYLNDLYGWDKRWQEYEYRYSTGMRNAIYPYFAELEETLKKEKAIRTGNYYRRAAAFAIDMGILGGIAWVLYMAGNYFADNDSAVATAAIWAVIYVYIVIPLQESSSHQATLGKRILGLQVVNRKGGRLRFVHAFLRNLITGICCYWITIIVWFNLLLYYYKGELVQDTVTRSYVQLKNQ